MPTSAAARITCPDAQLQTALRGVVHAIDQLPELEKPKIAAVEGSEATIEAFRRLTATFYGVLSFKLPPSADELRELQKKAVQSVENATAPACAKLEHRAGRAVEARLRAARRRAVRRSLPVARVDGAGAAQPPRRLLPKMQAAERGPVIQILSRFNDIHRDREIRENFEIFRHVVFDMNGDYYVAVPLDAPPTPQPARNAKELRVEAQLLANLFASFEKEKIFKRTMLPTTGSIQKRLKRQGSKFAGSEAFRVYKFTDGAWSDIILGAVMGAAKRAENDKRTFPSAHLRPRPLEADIAAVESDPAPSLAAPLPRDPAPLAAPRPAPAQEAPAAPAGNPVAPVFAPAAAPRTAQPAYAAAADVTGPRSAPRTAPRVTAPPRPYRMPSLQPVASAPKPDPDHVARFGPYASAYRPQPVAEPPVIEPAPPQAPRVARPKPRHPEAEVTVRVPSPATDAPESALPSYGERDSVVVSMSREVRSHAATAQEAAPFIPPPPMVGVTLARETATFSIPAEATPASLKDAIARVTAPPPLPVQPPPPPPVALKTEQPARLELVPLAELEEEPASDVKIDPLSERDLAIISRMAPPAAE